MNNAKGNKGLPKKEGLILKDSGDREQYDTKAIRDSRVGKGRYDLLSPFAIRRIAGIYESGAIKYADRNWEKGMPISRFLDSALRRIFQYIMGHRDEDHLAQAGWNILGALHMEHTHPEMDDMPHYGEEP